MPLLNLACPNCIKVLHTDEVWFEHPETGKLQCHSCGHELGKYTEKDLEVIYNERVKHDE